MKLLSVVYREVSIIDATISARDPTFIALILEGNIFVLIKTQPTASVLSSEDVF